MKLYFPTSSLNFNDMFATESISPKSFYAKRSFGTKRNFTTELGCNENILTLFRKVPYFDLIESNKGPYDEYPMILELDLNQKDYNIQQFNEDIFFIDSTIYFNLDNLKLFFFSDDHLLRIIQKSKLVIETKCVAKYRSNFKILDNSKEIKNITIPQKPELPNLRIESELEVDRIFNSVKGILYAYIFCSSSKVDENVVTMRQVAYKLNEILAYSDKLQGESEVINDILLFARDQVKKQYSKFKNPSSLNTNNIEINNIFRFEKRKLDFKSNLFNEKTEQDLFEKILTYLIDNSKEKVGDLEKSEKTKLVKEVISITQSVELSNKYEYDNRVLHKRFLMDHYEANVNEIDSLVLRNLYALLLKYNNPDEMKIFLKEKNIDKNFILYTFMGAFIGYSGLDREITEKLFKVDNNNVMKEIDAFLDNIRKEIRNSVLDKESYLKQLSLENELFNEINLNTKNKEENLIDSNNFHLIVKDIYKELQLLKQNKVIGYFIKSKNITLENDAVVTVERQDNNVELKINYKRQLYEVMLIHKENANKELLTKFKKEMKLIGMDIGFVRGNYPIVSIPILSSEKEIPINIYNNLLQCLKQLNNISKINI